jgi:hypothetical protein
VTSGEWGDLYGLLATAYGYSYPVIDEMTLFQIEELATYPLEQRKMEDDQVAAKPQVKVEPQVAAKPTVKAEPQVKAAPLDAVVDRWFVAHFPGSVVARDVDAYSYVYRAVEELKSRLRIAVPAPAAPIKNEAAAH